MKNYISHLISFFLIFSIVISLFLLGRNLLFKNFEYKISPNKHVLFMGASTLETAIDDRCLSEGLNVCSSAEGTMFTYIKLKYLLRDNPQIDTIFMGLTPKTIDLMSDALYTASATSRDFVANYSPLLSFDELRILLKNIGLVDFLTYYISSLPKIVCLTGSGYINNYFGGFLQVNKRLGDFPDAYTISDYKGNTITYNYMKKIINMCESRNVFLHFIYTPMYKDKSFLMDDSTFFYEYKKNFSQISLSDYSELEISDSLRADRYHLNYLGSKFFTKRIKTDFNLR